MSGAKGSATVFIGNLPYDVTEDDLKEVFGRAGTVAALRLVYDKETRQPKGYGFCDYEDAEGAMNAIRTLNDVEYSGRRLRIDLSDCALRSAPAGARSGPPIGGPPISGMQLALPGAVGERAALPAGPPPGTTASLGLPPFPGAAGALRDRMGMDQKGGPAGGPPLPAEQLEGIAPGATPEAILAEVSAHTQIAQTMASMPQAQLQMILGSMQRLAVEAPENARAMLSENPSLCYALLHAQLVLGLNLEPLLPPSAEEAAKLRSEAGRRPMGGAMPPGMGYMTVPGLDPGMPGGFMQPRPHAPRGGKGARIPPAPRPAPYQPGPRPVGPVGLAPKAASMSVG